MASRRAAEDLVREGRVTVDGEPAHLGQKIDPQTARVSVDGVPLPVRPDLVHRLLNKPRGVVSTADDPHGRPTVVDLVEAPTRVYPAGRLDADSEGLIVVTNDGDLTELLTHPRFGITKTYVVRTTGVPDDAALRSLRTGVELDDGPAAAVSARILDRVGDAALVEVVMGEGRNREVRRMFAAVDLEVDRLVRTAIGPLRDRTLKPGTWRDLTVDEVRRLYAAAEVSD
ncbi:MAG: pseudouridine synthase [Acidimicrobiia bacterium]|nr:pseudouridine synthase [Acidimicrobiia bacterium]